MNKLPHSTLLFHLSDELRTEFYPKTEKRPLFYWFNDQYHSHIWGNEPGATYMYFFLLNPAYTDVRLFTRHGKGDFKSLWHDYCDYLVERAKDEMSDQPRYLEPGIVMSFSKLVPNVVCKFVDGFSVAAHSVDSGKQAYFSLRQDNKFRHFNEIPELLGLLPDINNAVPVAKPSSLEVDDPSSFWPADPDNEGRMWL